MGVVEILESFSTYTRSWSTLSFAACPALKFCRDRQPRDTVLPTRQDTDVPNAQTCRLYIISPERLEHPTIFADELRAALDGGDVAAFQLRLKGVDDGAIARAADTLRPVCQQRGVAFIMNDRQTSP
jgi:Thiamine monophosphate synthase